jgi:hypothetical protein
MARVAVRWMALGAALLAVGSVAHADETADGLPKLTYRTAYVVGRNTLYLGLLAFEYGFTDRLEIGSDPPSWAARTVIPVLIPNLHVMETILDQGPVTFSVRLAGYWAQLQTHDGSSGSLVATPLSLFGSLRLWDRIWLHGEGTFVYVRALGSGDYTELHFGGGIAGITVQAGAMLECRLTRIFSLTATVRYQVYTGDLAFEGSGSIDPYTTAQVNGRAMEVVSHPWQAIGGVALLWKHIHLVLGAGYGYYFLPGPDIAYPKRTIVPDGNFAVVIPL